MIDRVEVARLLAEETFPYELNPEWERVTNVQVIEAARLVAEGESLKVEDYKSVPFGPGRYLIIRLDDE